jgi:hypothetical protein
VRFANEVNSEALKDLTPGERRQFAELMARVVATMRADRDEE